MTPDHGEILAWVMSLVGPVRVVCEAGPTWFGLAGSESDRSRGPFLPYTRRWERTLWLRIA